MEYTDRGTQMDYEYLKCGLNDVNLEEDSKAGCQDVFGEGDEFCKQCM